MKQDLLSSPGGGIHAVQTIALSVGTSPIIAIEVAPEIRAQRPHGTTSLTATGRSVLRFIRNYVHNNEKQHAGYGVSDFADDKRADVFDADRQTGRVSSGGRASFALRGSTSAATNMR